jgi:hypothetical protein
MCNDYEQHVRWADYLKMMQALELGIPGRQGAHDLPQADDIRINDVGPVMRAAGNEIEFRRGGRAERQSSIFGRRDGISPTAIAASSQLPRSLSSPARSTRRRNTGSR